MPAAFTLVRKGRRRPFLLTHMETASMWVNALDTKEGRLAAMFDRSVVRNAFCQLSGRNDTTFTNQVTPQAHAKVLA